MRKGSMLLVLLSLTLGTSLAFSQTVADAAKAKPAKKASRVITNDDIPSKPPEEPKQTQSGAAAASTSDAAEEKPTAKPEGESTPKENSSPEVQELEKQLTDLNNNIAARKKRTEEYREKMQNETDDHRREVQQEVLAAMEGDLQQMQKEGEDLQKKIDEKKSADKDQPKETAEPKDSSNQ